jgi:hypothetical protein
MKAEQNEIIYRYQQTLRRKEEQIAETEREIEALQKYLRSSETAIILNYNAEMKRSRLREDMEELNQLIEQMKTLKSSETFKLLPAENIHSSAHSLINKNSHLNAGQRQKIQQGIAEGKSNAQIAREIGVHRSTIGREIKRHALERENYQAEEAQHLAKLNQRMAFSFREFESLGMGLLKVLKESNVIHPLRRHMPMRFDAVVGMRKLNNFHCGFTSAFGRMAESGSRSDSTPLFKSFYDKSFSWEPSNFSVNDSTDSFYSKSLAADKSNQSKDYSDSLKKKNFRAAVRNQAEKEIFAENRIIFIFHSKSSDFLAIQTIKPFKHFAIQAIPSQKLCA